MTIRPIYYKSRFLKILIATPKAKIKYRIAYMTIKLLGTEIVPNGDIPKALDSGDCIS